jgi:hypothetical protein
MAYRRLRAPAADGGLLLDPPAGEIAAIVASNLAERETVDVELGGQSLHELRRAVRNHLVRSARDYTSLYADVSWVDERLVSGRVYLVGHQPELFHPGVWLKNFVLDALAKRDAALAMHVLIDNDEAGTPAIRVPEESRYGPRSDEYFFDHARDARPWEESEIVSEETFRMFGERVSAAIAPLVADPLVTRLWRHADAALAITGNRGAALAQLRHRLENEWGVRTLELPLSSLLGSASCDYFVAWLLAELPRFHQIHNAALAQYRALHKLRSASQPLPDLMEQDGWLEAPFWIWREADATRRKLFVKRDGRTWWIQDGLGDATTWSHRADCGGNPAGIAAVICSQRINDVKIRPRALVTTMMLRLLASDLFIHGIGGAKYDQVTDQIIADFFGIEPPGFVVASGTRLLPVPRSGTSQRDIDEIYRLLRELDFRPEAHLALDAFPPEDRQRAEQLIAAKREWLRPGIAPEQLAARHAALAEINAGLGDYVSTRREALQGELSRLHEDLRRQRILGSREFSFCLYPEATLRPWLLDAAARAI